MVRHPGDYPWSSYRGNAGTTHQPAVTPHDCWLALGEDDAERQANYRKLVEERLQQDDLDQVRHSPDKGLPTGNERFRREIERALSIRLGTRTRGRPKKDSD
jgi:REP-associated tyrosine transposase